MESLMEKSVKVPELMKMGNGSKQVKRSRNRNNPSRQRRLEKRLIENQHQVTPLVTLVSLFYASPGVCIIKIYKTVNYDCKF